MKKKVFNKKMSLSILAGVLVTIAIIGAGTYAWFTSSAEIEEASFKTAKVELTANGKGFDVYEFFNGHAFNLAEQDYLESLYGDVDAEALLTTWFRNSNPNTWQVGMTQEDYNEFLAQQDVINAALPGLEEALRIADERYQRAATVLGQLVDGFDSAIAALGPAPALPVAPDPDDYSGLGGLGQYLRDLATYAGELGAYNAYNNAVGLLLDGIEWAEGVEDGFRQAMEEAKAARDAQQKALDDLMDAVFSNIIVNIADPQLVTPGSIIYGEFEFENDSNVDTYFRINKAAVTGDGVVQVALARFTDEKVALVDGGDGYLYCPVKLAVGEDITLVIGAYVFGAANDNDAQLQEFGFNETIVELIQASNNAAYLSGWGAPKLTANFFQN